MFILTLLPWPHLVKKFAVGTESAPQFEQNIWELMLDLTPTAFARTNSVQDPRIQHLSLVLVLPWEIVFDASNLFLMWAICFWCKQFVFDVSNLFLMWAICFWCDSCGPPYLIHLQLFIYLNILNPLSWTQQYFSINIFFCSWEWL